MYFPPIPPPRPPQYPSPWGYPRPPYPPYYPPPYNPYYRRTRPPRPLPDWSGGGFWFVIAAMVAWGVIGVSGYLIFNNVFNLTHHENVDVFIGFFMSVFCFIGIALTILAIGFSDGKTWADFGFRTPSITWVIGAVILAVVFLPIRIVLIATVAVLLGIGESETAAGPDGFDSLLIWVFFGFVFSAVIVAPLAEELFFRGVLYSWLRPFAGLIITVGISGFLFGLAHLDFLMVVGNTVMGIVLGLSFEYSRSLWVPIIIHFVNNAIVVMFVFLLAISGF